MGQSPSTAKPPTTLGKNHDEEAASQHQSYRFSGETSLDDQELAWKFTTHKPIGLVEAGEHLRQHEDSKSWNLPGFGSQILTDSVQVPSLNPVEDRIAVGAIDVGSGREWLYWAVYDGHSGWATAEILASFLARYVGRELKRLSELEQRDNTRVQKAIEDAFVQLDKEILNDALAALNAQDIDPAEAICRIAPASSGSCATLILLDPTSYVLHVACVGDSRAVLGRLAQDSPEWVTIPLSTDQTGFNQDEIDRITQEHPGETPIDLSSGRVLNCAVTRSFGDNRWKWPLEALDRWTEHRFGRNSLANYLTPPYLTAQPVVTHTQMRPGDLVILASDGFWNHMESNEDAIHCASLWVKHNSGGATEMQQEEQGVDVGARGTWPYNWTVHRKYFIADGEKNLATHMMKNAFGGSQYGLFRSVMSTKAPDAKEARDDATVVAIRF